QFSPSTHGPFTVDVAWGDGSTTSFMQTTTGQIDPGGTHSSHTYGEEKPYTVTVKVTDTGDSKSDTKTFTVTVADQAVVQDGPVAVSADEGAAFTGKAVATFTDPGGAEPNSFDPTDGIPSHYKVASIDWGDTTPLDTSSGSIAYNGVPF